MKKYVLFIVAFFLNAIIIYGQAPNSWMQKADFGGGTRSFPAGFSIGGKAYIGTGNNGSLNTKDFWEYDPITNIWTRKTDFPGNARTSAVGFAIGNKGYIGSGDGGYYGPYYHDFWEYDPATDNWTRVADFPGNERHFATGFAIGTKGYFGAGANTSGTDIYYNDFWEYYPATDKWTRKADFGGGGRSNPAGFSIGDKGYIGCGWSYGWQRDFWQYDPATDKWTRKADFGGASREYVNAIGFSISGIGYLGTGYAGSVFRDFWQYDPANNLWTRVADFGGVGRSTAIGFSIGDKGYIGTGNNGTTVYKDFWEYTPGNIITAIPTITSFSPASGPISSTLTITGTNFSVNALDNIVYFGAVRAVVATATTTKLKVYVPVGTTYQSISVTTNGLTAFAAKPFVVTFEGGEETFTQYSFAPKKDVALGYNPCGSYIADFDGDGRTDLVTGDFNSSTISVLRNISHASAVSFAEKKNFTAGNGNRSCTAGDLDGDGKPEIVTGNINANTISVLRNTSTIGNILFAPKIDFTTGNSPGYAVIRDLDGDGKPEIIVTNFVSATFSVFRNTSSVGNISFDTRKDFTTALGNFNCAISDLNGDGKPDVVVGTEAPSAVFSVFQNTSTPGNISFAARLDYTTYAQRKGVAIGDLDGDGKPDLAISNFNNPLQSLSIFRNTSLNGAISFSPKKDYSSGGTGSDFSIINDLNGDGKPDIILNNYWVNNISVFKNIGSPGAVSFAEKVDYTTGTGPRFLNAGDIDGDGKPDIILDNLFSASVSVLRSRIGDNGCAPPSNLTVTNITGSSARLSWTLPDTSATTFEIRYRAAGDSAWQLKRQDGVQKGISLQGLNPNTSYQWQLRSNCGGEITKTVRGPEFRTLNSFVAFSTNVSDAFVSGRFSIHISPNPVTGNTLTLHIANASATNCQISITDMQGRMLISEILLLNTGILNKSIDLAALPKGIYILNVVHNKNERQQIKFVKAN